MSEISSADVWGVKILNTTPHEIIFGREDSDETISVPPCGILVNAKVSEKKVPRPQRLRDGNGAQIHCVKTVFLPDQKGRDFLRTVPSGTVVVGSIIAAQAYPGQICALVPCKGFERVPISEKRMRHDKFTIF